MASCKSGRLRIWPTENSPHKKCSQPRSTSACFVGVSFDHGLRRCQCFDAAVGLIRRHTRSVPFQVLAGNARRAGAILAIRQRRGRAIAIRHLAAWIGVVAARTTRISQGDGQSQNGESDSCAVHVSASCMLEGSWLVCSRSQVASEGTSTSRLGYRRKRFQGGRGFQTLRVGWDAGDLLVGRKATHNAF